jgi:hypothetical protein
MSGITNSSVEVTSWDNGSMDLLGLQKLLKGARGCRCRLEHATWVQSLHMLLAFHNTSVAFHNPVLAASSIASWGSCQHYFYRAGTYKHLSTEDESLMSLLLLLAPSPVQ